MSPPSVSELTERELIASIERHAQPCPDWLLVGIGDDAAVVEPERNRVEVLTVDMLVEGVHFDRRFTPPDAIGHRALAANLSDLAAMGAAPRLALLSLGLPGDLAIDDFDRLVAGLSSLAARHKVQLVGGNLTRTPGPLIIDITLIGTVKRRQALLRSGARHGDLIYVTGSIGGAAVGLAALREQAARDADASARRPDSSPALAACVERYLRPEPRIRAGLLLGRNRAASACIDLSDGLADAVSQVAAASGIGAAIDADAVPIDPAVRAWFEARGDDPVRAAIAGGDDYELLFTIRPRLRGRLRSVLSHAQVPLTKIGECTDSGATVLRRTVAGAVHEEPLPPGFAHFR